MNDKSTPPEDLPTTQSLDGPSNAPSTIGPYRILQKIGEGGMGEVYEAEQERPVRRKVAVKIIKWGMDTKQVVARFEAERQALAMMNHPNIAKVFDAGATGQGRPYFVMEFVKGVPITEHCDRQRLTTPERLTLFMRVCEGVQHAHQKAVIHRDIKPANILVAIQDGQPVPKIIDFGVAKATEQRLTERTLFTELGQFVGTPEYMSPEQAEMTVQDVDTRTDVYSLGVVLYELLVGALPFDPRELRREGFDEMRRRIREDEPSKPSTKVSTLGESSSDSAKNRRTDPSGLVRQLRGDLDWITMKSLEKDRARRYGSPNELAADLNRYLRHEPVAASPPSTAYRLGKFVRRHRLGVAAGGLVALAMALGIVGTTLGLMRATRAEERAREEAKTSERVSMYLARLLGSVDPARLGGLLLSDLRERVVEARKNQGASEREAAVSLAGFDASMSGVNTTDAALRLIDEEILHRAGRTIQDQLAEEPVIAGRLEDTIGATYAKLGLLEAAGSHLSLAMDAFERELGRDHPDTLRAMHNLGILYKKQGQFEEARSLHVETLERRRRVLGGDHPDTLNSMGSLASLLVHLNNLDEAEPLYREVLERQTRVLGENDRRTLISMTGLAVLYRRQDRLKEAEPLYLEILDRQRRVLGEDDPNTLATMNNLAVLYKNQNRYGEAEQLYLDVIDTEKRLLGDDHPNTLTHMNNLATLYRRQDRLDEAERLILEVFEGRKAKLGDSHPLTVVTQVDLAKVYDRQGRLDAAEPLYLEALEKQRRVLAPDHPYTLNTMLNLSSMYSESGRLDDAEPLILEAIGKLKESRGEDHSHTLLALHNLANLRQRQGRLDEAVSLHLETMERQRRKRGPDHLDTLLAMYSLGCDEALRGNRAAALEWLRQAVDHGYSDLPSFLEEPCLESLHGDPEFEAIVAEVKRRAAQEK